MKLLLAAQYSEARLAAHFATGQMLALSPKLDGIRCSIQGTALARSLKPIPNRHIQSLLSKKELEGYDGELIMGDPQDPDVYTKTFSAVMTIQGTPKITYYVFDQLIDQPWTTRYQGIQESEGIVKLPHILVNTLDAFHEARNKFLGLGYEGIIARRLDGRYKPGRSTEKELLLMKFKLEDDMDLPVIGFYEAMHNDNQAFVNETGNTDRSTHAENLVPMNTLGGFNLRLNGQDFKCAPGKFTHAERKEIWDNREKYQNRLLKFRYMPYGIKDAPRHPRAIGWRDEIDT